LHGKRDGNSILYHGIQIISEGRFIEDRRVQPPLFANDWRPGAELELNSDRIIDFEVTTFSGALSVLTATLSIRTGLPPHQQIEKITQTLG
jgi:hypothetical protein